MHYITVNSPNGARSVNISVNTDNLDNASRIAFRYVNKRREKDYQELMDWTRCHNIEEIPQSMNSWLLSMT